ncbi:MAG TPA: NUDIX domain-containing protein [Candidatus Acidoferrales bacterium]|nr:NUDIX domain-containing protein [Candidatus Acidoferrales bacterium]
MVVVAAIIARNGRVLACQRSRKSKFALKWEFPGGKVQPGETPEVALERELEEELGVRAEIGREILRAQHKYPQMREGVQLIFFRADLGSAEIENRIFEKIEWVEPEKLTDMDFLEADRELIEKLARKEIHI